MEQTEEGVEVISTSLVEREIAKCRMKTKMPSLSI